MICNVPQVRTIFDYTTYIDYAFVGFKFVDDGFFTHIVEDKRPVHFHVEEYIKDCKKAGMGVSFIDGSIVMTFQIGTIRSC